MKELKKEIETGERELEEVKAEMWLISFILMQHMRMSLSLAERAGSS